jgi:PTS system nitrogen regulatory IIA component
MKSLLNALREGRLVELPDTHKDNALQFLVNLVAAIPDHGADSDVMYEGVMARERSGNTGIGMGIACPHVRVPGSGELLCAVGWNPTGIDYGSPDGKLVHLVILYYVPDSHKNFYLKEISALIQSVKKENGIKALQTAESISEVREKLLDWVSVALEAGIPQTRARMIRLETREAAVSNEPISETTVGAGKLQLIPCSVITLSDGGCMVLTQNAELSFVLERQETFPLLLQQQTEFDLAGYRILRQSATNFSRDRNLYECIVVKLT